MVTLVHVAEYRCIHITPRPASLSEHHYSITQAIVMQEFQRQLQPEGGNQIPSTSQGKKHSPASVKLQNLIEQILRILMHELFINVWLDAVVPETASS